MGFLQNLYDRLKNTVSTDYNKAANFVRQNPTPYSFVRQQAPQVAQQVRQAYQQPQVQKVVNNPIVRNIRTLTSPEPAQVKNRIKLARDYVVQPFFRGTGEVANTVLGRTNTTPRLGKIGTQLYGEKPVGNVQERYQFNKDWAQGKNLGKASAPLAFGMTALALGGDITPIGGGGAKTKLAKQLTKIDDVAKVKKLTGAADDVVSLIAKSKNAKEIDTLLSKGKQIAPLSNEAGGIKPLSELPDNFNNMVSSARNYSLSKNKIITKDEFLKAYDGEINNQNLTHGDTARKVDAYMRKELKMTPSEFYDNYIHPEIKSQPAFATPESVQSDVIKQATEARKAQLQRDGFVAPVDNALASPKVETPPITPKNTPQGIVAPKTAPLEQGGAKQARQIKQPLVESGRTLERQPIVQKPVSQVSPKISLNTSLDGTIPQSSEIVNDTKKILTGSGTKERGFITSIKTSENTPQVLKDMVSGTYVPKSANELKSQAKKLIQTDINAAEQVAINPTNDVHIQIGNELINHYSSTGQLAKAKALSEAMANSGTELGRAVQAFANYDKTTPAGAIKFAQTTINKFNRDNPTAKLALSDEMVTSLFTKAKQIQNMAEGKERNIASQQLMNQVNDLIPSSVADKAVTVWKAGLLTSLRTTERNLLGNTVHGVAEVIKDIPASIADMVMSAKTGKRSLSLTTKGIGQGVKSGWSRASDIMTLGFDPERTIEKFDVKRVSWGNNPVEQGLKKYTDFVFNWMGAQDKPFYHSAFARSLYDQAGAEAITAGQRGNKAFIEELVKNPTDIMKKLATKDATIAVFQDKNALSKMINGLKNKAGGARWATEVVAPFTGVPSSIAGQVVAYSPVGLVKGGFDAIKVMSGKVPELQRQAAQEIGRGVIGTGVATLAGMLAAKGLITGQPKDANEAKQWELEGKQANSVMIGGKWRSINSVGPEALVALAGSKIAVSKDRMAAVGNIGKDFLSQTFLQGIQQPLNAITDPARYAGSYISGQVASLIPNAVKDVAKAFDPLQREAYVPKNIVESTKNAVKSGIPLLRNTLLPKRNALGDPLPNENTGYKAFVDLFNSKTPIDTPVVNELSRLFTAGESATPSKLTPDQTINGKKVNFTPKALDTLEMYTGEELQKYWNQTMSDPNYQALSDADKSNKLSNTLKDIRAVAKIQIGYTEGLLNLDEVQAARDKLTATQKAYFDTRELTSATVKPKVAKVTSKSTKGKSGGKGKKAKAINVTAIKASLKSASVSKIKGNKAPTKMTIKSVGKVGTPQVKKPKVGVLNGKIRARVASGATGAGKASTGKIGVLKRGTTVRA
jgi:hypothetical protein